MPSSTAKTPEWLASPMQPGPLWYLGYPDQALKRSHEALTLAQELSHPFSLAFALSFAAIAPSVPPGGAGSPRAGRGSRLHSRPSRGFRTGWRWGLSCGAGRWPSRDRERKGLRRYARAWPPSEPQGQRCHGRIFLPCWPRRMGKGDRQKKG